MPVICSVLRQMPRLCGKRYSWSTVRGGCRFTPGHVGQCKPGQRR